MRITLLLLITLTACSESEPDYPTGQILQGKFVLTKAVARILTDIGGPDLDDPVIIRRVSHTFHYPSGIGSLVFDGSSIVMDAPMELQPIFIEGRFKTEIKERARYYSPVPHLEIAADYRDDGTLIDNYRSHLYWWLGNTLKIEYRTFPEWHIVWDLYWERYPLP